MTKMNYFNKRILCKDTNEIVFNYKDYLLTRHWRILRVKIAKINKFRCEMCDEKIEVGYQVHHKTYDRLGKERLNDLMFLCENCHKNLHIALRAHKNNISNSKNERKTCFNCYYSQLMIFKGKNNRTTLWCNKKCFECNDNLCCYYKKGELKKLPKSKGKNKKQKDKSYKS